MKVPPIADCVLPGTEPVALFEIQMERICQQFELRGWSNHSPRGSMLWCVIAYCRANSIAYDLWRNESAGFLISKAGSEPAKMLEGLGFKPVKGF